ncbi:MAG: hypothetical protein ACKVON_02135 [Beijerinckiaceae bacterium]
MGHSHHHTHGSAQNHALDNAQNHVHDHAPAAEPLFSLLQLSALQRLGGASCIVIVLWAAVFWALT